MFRHGFAERTDGRFLNLKTVALIKPNHPVQGVAECLDLNGNLLGRIYWPHEEAA